MDFPPLGLLLFSLVSHPALSLLGLSICVSGLSGRKAARQPAGASRANWQPFQGPGKVMAFLFALPPRVMGRSAHNTRWKHRLCLCILARAFPAGVSGLL